MKVCPGHKEIFNFQFQFSLYCWHATHLDLLYNHSHVTDNVSKVTFIMKTGWNSWAVKCPMFVTPVRCDLHQPLGLPQSLILLSEGEIFVITLWKYVILLFRLRPGVTPSGSMILSTCSRKSDSCQMAKVITKLFTLKHPLPYSVSCFELQPSVKQQTSLCDCSLLWYKFKVFTVLAF